MKLCILHFQPVEKYPPAFNFTRVLAATGIQKVEIHLITTDPGNGKQKIQIPDVHIHRVAKWQSGMSRTTRMKLYVRFVVFALLRLLKEKPSALLYYETGSAGAPYFYNIWLNPSCRLFIHYHEYTSPEEYASGMIFHRWLHRLENSLYKKANWVSHTNKDRMKLFDQDLGVDTPKHTYILPNHPPAAWTSSIVKTDDQITADRIGFVYVGALSIETMYVKQMADYIAARPAECFWDIYSDNHTTEAVEFLEKKRATNISFKGAVNYDALPGTLSNYQVGLVLYNGHIPNYIYNVPNKFYEYYVCGLDVWFPKEMVSCLGLVTRDTFPKVIPINFEKLDDVSFHKETERRNFKYHKQEYACEKTYLPLVRLLINEPEELGAN